MSPGSQTTEPTAEPETVEPSDECGRTGSVSRAHPSGVGIFAAATAFLLPLAYSPALYNPVWGPKSALALLFAGVGVPLLIWQRNRAGLAAAALLAIATVSTLLSDNPVMSLVGLWNWGTGLLFVASLVGAWAVGRSLTTRDRQILEASILASTSLIAVIAILQMMVNLNAVGLPLVFGRPTALQGNPVYLSGVLLAGLLLATYRVARKGTRWVPPLFLFATALAVAQGRVSLLIATAAPLAVLRVAGGRRSALSAGAIGLGLGAGVVLTIISPLQNAPAERTGESGAAVAVTSYGNRESLGSRIDTWWAARHAVAERPIWGAGPGRYWAATAEARTLESTRRAPSQYYSDPHNFVVEYLTTTGVVGLALLVAWLALSARNANGGLALMAAGLGLVHLLQPQNAVVTPLALLALGASTPRALTAARAWPLIVGGVAAGTAAAMFIAGQFALRQAYLDLERGHAATASRLLAPWPEPADRRAMVAASVVNDGEEPDWSEVRHWLTIATERDPADPRWWVRLGDFEQSRRRIDAAEAAYLQALELDPWSPRGTAGMLSVAKAREDERAERYWTKRARAVLGRD